MTDIAALEKLIAEYFDIGCAVGSDRPYEFGVDAAQRKWSEIQAAIRQLAPVPAQGAEGAETLADRLEEYPEVLDALGYKGDALPADLIDAARRLRNYPESPDGSFISGEVVRIGDDRTGQPRILIHTTREAIMACSENLLGKRVRVAADAARSAGGDDA